MNRLGDISAFVTPAGQLLLPGGVRPECIPSAYYLNSIQCPFNGVPLKTKLPQVYNTQNDKLIRQKDQSAKNNTKEHAKARRNIRRSVETKCCSRM